MSNLFTRRRLVTSGLATAAGASGIGAAGMLVLASGCVAPPVPPTTTTTTPPPQPPGPNLLANPSFESDVFGSTFTNWTVTP